MNIKINQSYIYILILILFFFFWGVDLQQIKFSYILSSSNEYYKYFNNIKLSYSIIFLLIPIFYNCMKERTSLLKQIYNYQKYIMLFTLFIVIHFFLVKFYYNESIDKSEIANLFYLLILSVIYSHYRRFISVNFKKILTSYLIIFIVYSIYEGSQILKFGLYDDEGVLYFTNLGQCNENIFLIGVIQRYLHISFSNSIYLENSHLAMMTIAVFFSSLYILLHQKKKDILFLVMFLINVIITLNNLSTTYFVGYFASQIILLLFFFNKINSKLFIITFIFLLVNSYLFFSDKHCTKKVTDFNVQDVLENDLAPSSINLTTLVYQRSIMVAKETLLNHSLGWGIDGMDNANHNLLLDYDDETAFWELRTLNIKDGLSNFFKLFTEFGFFAFIIYLYFLKYIINIKNINSYNLFIIILFITMSIRGAGYFNGGFIFCLLEFFYNKKVVNDKIKRIS